MAYGIKYKCTFSSVKGLEYKVYILQKDYNSAEYKLRMGGNPVQINYTSGSESKFEVIRGSECILNFFSEYDGQFTEIMTADKNEFMIQVWVNGSLHWQGYVIQDNYSEPFQSAPYQVSLRATDGLGDLKLMDFAKDNGTVFLSNMTFAEAILNCLGQLKNGTKLVTSNNLFEARIDRNTVSNETFNQLTVNPFIFLKDQLNAKKCDEVLKTILQLFQCYIFYKAGKYYVERVNYKLSETLTRRTYNINFNDAQEVSNVVSSENIRSSITHNGALRFINNDHNSTYVSAFNKVTLDSDSVDPSNVVVNNLFRFWDDNTSIPFSWNKIGTLAIAKRDFGRDGSGLQIITKAADNQISYSTNMLMPARTSFQGSLTATGNDSLSIKLASRGNVRLMVKATTPSTTYYLTCSGYTENSELKYQPWFKTTTTTCKIDALGGDRQTSAEGAWFVTTLNVPIPAGTTTLDFGFMPSYTSANYGDVECLIREFTPTIKAGDAARSTGDNYSIVSNKNVRETYDDFKPQLGEFANNGLSNQILINTSTGRTYTQDWYRDGKSESKALFQIAVQSILNQYRTPYRQFSGSIYGEFDFGKVYEIETLNGWYMPYKVSSDLKADLHQVEFFELLNDDDVSSDKYTRFVNYKDGDYTTRSNVLAGTGQDGGGRPSRGTRLT
ncbi:hypothetical protein [Pedobacter sp. MC2016-24]|uniref:hypothetical protein n=1 Tax=Pedobacter sp. MC2016-24 TaxID=2780090 RepID=UPI00188217D5|nr:hypothetical protein [Pedobacter sp. MC2016-24]MBE9598736.1 hypothetical protein [Pedobacter sp. MC2016-24]